MIALKYLHLLSLVLWFGGMVFFTFVAAPAIFSAVPRETAGQVVGAIFPRYWIAGYIGSSSLLVTLMAMAWGRLSAVLVPLVILAIVTALAFVSGMVVGKKARAIKAGMAAATGQEKKEGLRKSFAKVHGVSAAINATIVILMLAYVAFVPSIMGL